MKIVQMWFAMARMDRVLFPVANNKLRPHKEHALGFVVNECERALNLEMRKLR